MPPPPPSRRIRRVIPAFTRIEKWWLAFGSSLRYLTSDLPAEHHGSVLSAFYLVTYTAMAVPTILAGIAATIWNPAAVFAPFSIAAATIASTAAAFGLRERGSAQYGAVA